ncbi:corrinoid methyltransferase protein [Dehalobacter sp. CF]|nr:corrinoid methyltransferase protein [Dehalobacter sp. CF]
MYSEVRQSIATGVPALEIIADLQTGLTNVGALFSKQEYFLSELMLSADLFKQASELLGSDNTADEQEKLGTFLIGTVETDIHDIGKNIVASIMQTNGFKVIDLGEDVPVAKFVEAVKEHQPQIIGLSCLLTTCFEYMKKTIDAIKAEGLDKGRLILIGGGPTDENTLKYVGGDIRCPDAQNAVEVSKKFLGVK